MKIKSGCKWGGIRYEIFTVKENKSKGFLGHSFRDGTFSVEMTAPCEGQECNFYDLNPQQKRK